MNRRLLIAVALSALAHVVLGISMWHMERPEKEQEERVRIRITPSSKPPQTDPSREPATWVDPSREPATWVDPSREPATWVDPSREPATVDPPKPKPEPPPTDPSREPATVDPPKPKPPKPARKKTPRKKIDMPTPRKKSDVPDKPVTPKKTSPKMIGLNLDGSVRAGSGHGIPLPTGDGFPTPTDDPGDWGDGPDGAGDGDAAEAQDGTSDGAEDGTASTGSGDAKAAEARAEAREELEDADIDGDGRLDEAEKAEQIADRKHDAVKTRSLRRVRKMPKVTKVVRPPYPEELRELEVEGVVELELVVDTEGRVSSVKILKRLHPTLDKLARDAAHRLRFSPATVDNKPTQVKIPWEFIFVME